MVHFQKIIGFYDNPPPQGLSEARRVREYNENYRILIYFGAGLQKFSFIKRKE